MRYSWYHFPWFDDWLEFSGTIPDVYWNVYSEEQRYKFLCCRLQKLVEYASKMGVQLNMQGDAINELAAELASMKENFADEFEDYYKTRICEWLQENLACIVANAVKFVQFGLTDTGRFVAFIPSNWQFLQFDTIMAGDDFGKLKIVY